MVEMSAPLAGAREHQVELHHRAGLGRERMRMHHVDQVLAGDQHVAPRAEVLLEAITRADDDTQLRGHTGDGF